MAKIFIVLACVWFGMTVLEAYSEDATLTAMDGIAFLILGIGFWAILFVTFSIIGWALSRIVLWKILSVCSQDQVLLERTLATLNHPDTRTARDGILYHAPISGTGLFFCWDMTWYLTLGPLFHHETET